MASCDAAAQHPEVLAASRERLWQHVDAIIDAAASLADLRAHGLHLLAARRWRALGRSVPPDLEAEEVRAAIATTAVPLVLAQIRAAYDGPIVVMKGPVVAAHFPAPSRRPFVDLDLLVPDATAAREALLAGGFVPSGDPATYVNLAHQLRPLRAPNAPFDIELHHHPKWIDGLSPPAASELLETSAPAALGVEGVLTLAPSHHVLVLTAHQWAHWPLTRLLRLLDVAVMREGVDAAELERIARRWNMARVWKTTSEIADALFGSRRRRPLPLRVSGRGLETAREPTMLEVHAGRLVNPFFVYERMQAIRVALSSIAGFVLRQEDESWRAKILRTARQITHPRMRKSEYVQRAPSDPGPTHGNSNAVGS